MSEQETITTDTPRGVDTFKEILEQVKEEFRDDSEPEDESEESSEDYDSQETSETEEEQEGDEEEQTPAYFDEDSDEEETEEEEDTPDAEAGEDQEEEEEKEEEESAESEDEQSPAISPELREMQEQLQAALGMLDQQKQFNGKLVDRLKTHEASLQERGQQQQPPPQRTLENQQLEDAFRLSLFGTAEDKDSYESLPASVKKKAKDAVQRYSQEETLNILYPEKRYTDQIQYYVMQDVQRYVQQAMGGLTEDYNARKAENVFSKYEDEISTSGERKRLLEVMNTIPGHDSDNWQIQEKVLDLAVQQVIKERKEEDLTSRERDLDMRERQIQQRGTKRSGAKGKRGRRRTRSQVNKMKSGEDMVEFARSLEKEIRNGR